VATPASGMLPERVFYTMLRGPRSKQKRIKLGKCILLCAIKWRNLTKKDYGKPLQPSTWDTLLKTLFAKFHEEGINFKHKNILTKMVSFMQC
jgi:hypothetical protein